LGGGWGVAGPGFFVVCRCYAARTGFGDVPVGPRPQADHALSIPAACVGGSRRGPNPLIPAHRPPSATAEQLLPTRPRDGAAGRFRSYCVVWSVVDFHGVVFFPSVGVYVTVQPQGPSPFLIRNNRFFGFWSSTQAVF